MGEYRKVFDRIMDQLYNHPEEMRARLLAKYDMPQMNQKTKTPTAIEMLRSMQ